MAYPNLSKFLPADLSGERYFTSVSGKQFRGTVSTVDPDEALLHVILYDQNERPLLVAVDMDTGAGTAYRGAIGLLVAASGGPVLVPGDATNGLKVQIAGALAAGSAVIGKVGIDQTTPGTTDSVSVATGQGAGAVIGTATSGSAVTTDASGTLQQYLRGIVTQIGAVTASPVSNTLADRLKAIATALAGTLTVATHAVTQSGTWTVQPGNTANTTAWKVDGSAVTQPVSIGPAGQTIGKNEDAASANGDVGVPAFAIRKATPANTSDTDGDYEALQMSAGRLWASATIDAALPAGTNTIGKTLAAETTATATVSSSGTVSGAVDTRGYRYQGIVVPSTFDGSVISFQVSADNSTYQALNDISGIPVSMPVAASQSYDLPGELTAWPYFKVVCATTQTTTATDFVVVLRS